MHTAEQLAKTVEMVGALAEAIRELGSIPSGHLYARVMGQMSLVQFQDVIKVLGGAGLVRDQYDVLTWIGPNF